MIVPTASVEAAESPLDQPLEFSSVERFPHDQGHSLGRIQKTRAVAAFGKCTFRTR